MVKKQTFNKNLSFSEVKHNLRSLMEIHQNLLDFTSDNNDIYGFPAFLLIMCTFIFTIFGLFAIFKYINQFLYIKIIIINFVNIYYLLLERLVAMK